MSQEAGTDREARSLEGYRGSSFELLKKAGAKIGNRLKIKTTDGFETSGLLIPRYEHADPEHIVLKLKSGYNIGIASDNVESILVVDDSVGIRRKSETPLRSVKSNKKVLLLSTGGTIASRVDYRTGAVHPALSADDLYEAVPELGTIANIIPEVVFSAYSENLGPVHWQHLSERIVSSTREHKPDGVVVMLGTDTLAYVSAALGFSLLGLAIPVVCVGAQRSSDRPSSDSAINLKAATRFASESHAKGVFIAMHKSENDDVVAVHSSVRVRKNHTSRRDAFESIDSQLIAEIGDESKPVIYSSNDVRKDASSNSELCLKTSFEPKVALLKFHPGFHPELLDFLASEKGVKAIIIEGTGLGHVSSETVSKIAELTSRSVFVGIASQCIWGRVDLNVYNTGRDLIAAGAISLGDMLAETALAKVSWVFANFARDEAARIMQENLVGEITLRTSLG